MEFKIGMYTWKALNNMAPPYIRDLIKIKSTGRTTRSSKSIVLENPIINLVSGRNRSFTKASPEIWNSLPDKVKNSKTIDSQIQFENLSFQKIL